MCREALAHIAVASVMTWGNNKLFQILYSVSKNFVMEAAFTFM